LRHHTLANKWQEALVRLAFTPCLHSQYTAAKNTSDIALTRDAMEALFDQRADTFCLVTAPQISPTSAARCASAALRFISSACPRRSMRCATPATSSWHAPPAPAEAAESAAAAKAAPPPPASKPAPKRRPNVVLNAVSLLAANTPDGRVGLGALGQYLKRTAPGFSPKTFGHAALSDPVRAYPELLLTQEKSGYWVSLKPKAVAQCRPLRPLSEPMLDDIKKTLWATSDKLRANMDAAEYQNRSIEIETARVTEELVEMAKKCREAVSRGEALGLTDDEVRFYDALANNESAVKDFHYRHIGNEISI